MSFKSLAALTLAVLLGAHAAPYAQNSDIDPPTKMYDVSYAQPGAPNGATVVEFSGDMKVPPMTSGTHYLWPGVFAADLGGVLQPVLSSATGRWSLNNTWYYGTQQDAANSQNSQNYAFDVDDGDTIHFDIRKGSVWSMTTSSGSKTATAQFPEIPSDKAANMPYVSFDVELWTGAWDFGPLEFSNIKIVSTATGDASTWCNENPYPENPCKFSVSGVTSSVQDGNTVCSIETLTLESP